MKSIEKTKLEFNKYETKSAEKIILRNKNFKSINKYKKISEKSCGCIIIDKGKVLLIQQKRGNWGFPKGHVEFNETERQTAIREVKEETNLDVRIFKNKRYIEKYISNNGKLKQVVYFLAKHTGGIEKKQDSEIKSMIWLNFEDAINKITYENTRKLFLKVLKDLKIKY